MIAGAMIFAGCTSDTKSVVTKNGVEVSYLSEGEGPAPASGDIITINMTYKDSKGNLLFDTEDNGGPAPLLFDTSRWQQAGLLYEAFKVVKVGDSITFDIPAANLFETTFRGQVPDSIDASSNISFVVGVVATQSAADYTRKQDEAQLAIDVEIIDAYLSENNIEAITTESGLRYVITQEGQGSNPIAGNDVSVHYNGTLLDGTKFDSSYDRGQPFSFSLGKGRVIKGWDEGIALLNKGAKATLYIPSTLAYGSRGSGPTIGPNTVLKFEVELIDFR